MSRKVINVVANGRASNKIVELKANFNNEQYVNFFSNEYVSNDVFLETFGWDYNSLKQIIRDNDSIQFLFIATLQDVFDGIEKFIRVFSPMSVTLLEESIVAYTLEILDADRYEFEFREDTVHIKRF